MICCRLIASCEAFSQQQETKPEYRCYPINLTTNGNLLEEICDLNSNQMLDSTDNQ